MVFFTEVWVIASFQDPSLYSSRSKQCCSLDDINSFSNFHSLNLLFRFLGIVPGALKRYHLDVLQHFGPLGWGLRIHRLHLCRGVRLPNKYPGYDTKQSDSEAPVMLELWGMQSTPSLLLLPGPLWPRVVAPDKVLSNQIELNCVITLDWIVWNQMFLHLTVYTQKTVLILNWIVWNFYQNVLTRR